MVGPLALTAAAAASSAVAPALVALRDVVAPAAGLLPPPRAVAALAGNVVPRVKAVACAANVRPSALRRGALGAPVGLPSAGLLAVPRRQAGAEGATEAEQAPPLAVAPLPAAPLLLVAVAVRHAQVRRPTADLHGLEAAARILAAASTVVLPDARRKNPVPPAPAIQASAVTHAVRRAEATVVLHLASKCDYTHTRATKSWPGRAYIPATKNPPPPGRT